MSDPQTTNHWSDRDANEAGFSVDHGSDGGLQIDDDGYDARPHGHRWLSWSEANRLHEWLGRKIDEAMKNV